MGAIDLPGSARRGSVWVLTLASILAWGAAGSAAGTGDAAPDARAQDLPEVSDEITVTAQKREQSIDDVGLTVVAFSGEELAERGLADLSRLTAAIPNVSLYDVTGGGVPVVVIRGIGLRDFRVNNTPAAAFYVDEVYQSSVAMIGFNLFDLERVEVLKGPQGGIYGRNTTGGAIQVISRQPRPGEADGHARLGTDQHGELAAEAAATATFGDATALRLAARAGGGGGYFRSVAAGFDHGGAERWALRSILRLEPNESLEVSFKLHAGADRSETPLLRTMPIWAPGSTRISDLADGVLFNYGNAAPGLGICPAILAGRRDDTACASSDGRVPAAEGLAGVHDSLSVERPRLDNRWLGIDLAVHRSLARGRTLTSVTSYQSFDHGRLTDLDAVALTQHHIDYGSEIEQVSQELRLSGPVGRRGFIVAGLNLARDELWEATFLTATSGLLPLAFGGITRAEQRYVQQTDAASLYGRLDRPFARAWSFVGELRYTVEDKRFRGGVELPETGTQLAFADDDQAFDNLSGKIGLEYRTASRTLWYASLSRGFKAGGFFGGFVTNPAQLEPYGEETVLAYEIGCKAQPADSLRLSAALFSYDVRDLQANARETIDEGVAIGRLTNVGDAAVVGAELELGWRPTASLAIDLGVGITDAEIDASQKTSTDAFSVADRPLEGVRLPSSPRASVNLVLIHEAGLANGLFLRSQLAMSYRSEQDLSFVVWQPERAIFEEDAYGLVGLRFTLGSRDDGWSFTAYAENLLDEAYRTVGRVSSLGAGYEIFGPPRTAGAFARYRW